MRGTARKGGVVASGRKLGLKLAEASAMRAGNRHVKEREFYPPGELGDYLF